MIEQCDVQMKDVGQAVEIIRLLRIEAQLAWKKASKENDAKRVAFWMRQEDRLNLTLNTLDIVRKEIKGVTP